MSSEIECLLLRVCIAMLAQDYVPSEWKPSFFIVRYRECTCTMLVTYRTCPFVPCLLTPY